MYFTMDPESDNTIEYKRRSHIKFVNQGRLAMQNSILLTIVVALLGIIIGMCAMILLIKIAHRWVIRRYERKNQEHTEL